MSTAFGTFLKDWRNQRRMSQLDLGLCANVSARHISFLETGRARPSRSMVFQLCDELEVPRQARNNLLTAAGLAPAYANRPMEAAEMQPVLEAVDWMLERHSPYPAIALDRHWKLLKMNKVAVMLFSGFGIGINDSMLDILTQSMEVREAIENFDEVAHHTLARVRTESAHLGGDPVLDAAAARISELLDHKEPFSEGVLPPFVPTRYRTQGQSYSFFSTFSQFSTAEDVALSELKVEMLFPADEATRQLMLALA